MTDWLKADNNAVITGGASGIGLAAARYFLAAGMNVLIADRNEEALDEAVTSLKDINGGTVRAQACDVSEIEQVQALGEIARRHGNVHCLMNNAGAALRAGLPWESLDTWKQQLNINLWGIIHGCQAFLPAMLDAGEAAAVINTGSKQGITNPPGGYAYNLSKAGVKAYTESLAHALREIEGCPVRAHLMIPGFTYTGMIARFAKEKPPGAWTSDQAVEFMIDSLQRGDFYILCPDNETPRELDEKRIQWNADDLINNRPALSRWDPDFADAYDEYVKD